MKKEILINSTSDEVRIAITEDGKLTELFYESPDLGRNVGDIYLGKVAKVMHGIRAAFINLGFPQDAFLHFSDMDTANNDYKSILGDDSDVDDDDDEVETTHQVGNRVYSKEKPLPSNIQRGKDIIVQITKEPVGNKGVRVTTKYSIPGRYLVLIPYNRRIGVSKKIYNYREKRRLRSIVRPVLPEGFGAIIRTVAAGQDDNLILDDLNKLISTWNEIQNKMNSSKAPAMLYKDASTTSSVMRDLFRDDISKIIVDSKKLYKTIKNYVDDTSPEFSEKIELYSDNAPLFDVRSIEKQIEESLNKKVWLKNSGYVVIETTEAMTVIDVNSGKYAKSREQETNSLKINFDAAKEIVRQLRLRDIGGIVVIDFIDLYEDENKRKLFEEIRREFRRDRAKVTVLPMSDFGIVQITRQRIRQSILHRMSNQCPMCSGTGRVQSNMSYITEIERWLQRYKGGSSSKFVRLSVNPLIFDYLTSGFINKILRLCIRYWVFIKLEVDEKLPLSDFKFFTFRNKTDITEEYSM
ncbi:MAG: Rne/Rng family ribonuclease [Ignavibacteriae bacterium]|nr:Rne/Rng family ribonuclease [Ignavibacteriota bacterium]